MGSVGAVVCCDALWGGVVFLLNDLPGTVQRLGVSGMREICVVRSKPCVDGQIFESAVALICPCSS